MINVIKRETKGKIRVREREALHIVEGEEEKGEGDSEFEQQSKGFSGLGISNLVSILEALIP